MSDEGTNRPTFLQPTFDRSSVGRNVRVITGGHQGKIGEVIGVFGGTIAVIVQGECFFVWFFAHELQAVTLVTTVLEGWS